MEAHDEKLFEDMLERLGNLLNEEEEFTTKLILGLSKEEFDKQRTKLMRLTTCQMVTRRIASRILRMYRTLQDTTYFPTKSLMTSDAGEESTSQDEQTGADDQQDSTSAS